MVIKKILDLEKLEVDIYRGIKFTPKNGFLKRTFGGHIIGQSLVSAIRTTDTSFKVHSLHCYFLSAGDSQKSLIYIVKRIKDGRSFCTRQVNAIQNGKTIFTMLASFQTDQISIKCQDNISDLFSLEGLIDFRSYDYFTDTSFAQFDEWDVRIMPYNKLARKSNSNLKQQVWFRHRNTLPNDSMLHVCALAYVSDLTLLSVARLSHIDTKSQLMVTSLDHTIWFMQPFRIDDWLLYNQFSPWTFNGRSLTYGNIFNKYGDIVAFVAQEGLTRYKANFSQSGMI